MNFMSADDMNDFEMLYEELNQKFEWAQQDWFDLADRARDAEKKVWDARCHLREAERVAEEFCPVVARIASEIPALEALQKDAELKVQEAKKRMQKLSRTLVEMRASVSRAKGIKMYH